jgi:hypothetical protein
MPKNANVAKRAAAENKNKKAYSDVVKGKDGIVGRVEKAFGNGLFQITIADPRGNPKIVQGLIRGVFKGGAKSAAFLSAGMYAILATVQDRSEVHEILGVISTKKQIHELKKEGVFPKCLQQDDAADELFDYTDVKEAGEEEEELNLDDI